MSSGVTSTSTSSLSSRPPIITGPFRPKTGLPSLTIAAALSFLSQRNNTSPVSTSPGKTGIQDVGPFKHDLQLDLLPPLTGDTNIDLGNLQSFLEHLYHPHPDASMYPQMYVCIGSFALSCLWAWLSCCTAITTGEPGYSKCGSRRRDLCHPQLGHRLHDLSRRLWSRVIIYATIAIRHYRGQSSPGPTSSGEA